MIRSRGLTHIQLAVRDMERSIRFYKRVLGLEDKFKESESFVFLTTPGTHDIITLRQSDESPARAGEMGGIAHFGFHLEDHPDFEAALLAVVECGGTVVRRGVRETDDCPAEPWAFVRDPDGYLLELYSPSAREAPR